MTELQDLLARATDRIEPPRGAAAALLTARARRRRRRGAVAGAVVAGVVAAATVPLLVVGPPASAPEEPAPPTSPTTDLVVPGDAFDPADAADLPLADTVLPEDLGPLLAETPSGPSQPVAVAAWRTEQGVGLLGLDGDTWQLSLLDQTQGRPVALSPSGARVAVVGDPDLGIWIADVGTTPATPSWSSLPFPAGFDRGRVAQVTWVGETHVLLSSGLQAWLIGTDSSDDVERLALGWPGSRWVPTGDALLSFLDQLRSPAFTVSQRSTEGEETAIGEYPGRLHYAVSDGRSLAAVERWNAVSTHLVVSRLPDFAIRAELVVDATATPTEPRCLCLTMLLAWVGPDQVMLQIRPDGVSPTPELSHVVLWNVETGALARATSIPVDRHVAFAAAVLDGDPS